MVTVPVRRRPQWNEGLTALNCGACGEKQPTDTMSSPGGITMQCNQQTWFAVCFSALLTYASAYSSEPNLTFADFTKLHKELSSAKEPWQTIPWQLSLLEARALAAKENKPVYMLSRSGHPLGCV